MDMEMNSLKPAEVFKFFAEINRIPRPSKKRRADDSLFGTVCP